MPNLQVTAARLAGRPLLLTAKAAEEYGNRLANIDPSLIGQPRKLDVLTRVRRAVGLASQRPVAFDDEPYAPPTAPDAYAPLWLGEADDELEWGMTLKDGVALLNIDTPIADRGEAWCGTWFHGYDSIDAAIKTALADDRVKAIYIRMDCPGGVVSGGIQDLSETMREGREAAGGKPIWVFADTCCSAAYWIAAQADHIIAPAQGIVGSIGAVIVHTEVSAALEKAGVKVEPIQFGAEKTGGAYFQKLSETARADLQAWVNQAGRDFVAAVVEGRPIFTPAELLATEARVFCAAHDDPERSGFDLKFVDEVMGEAKAFASLVDYITAAPVATDPAAPAALTPEKENPMAKHKPGAQTPARRRTKTQLAAQIAALEEEMDGMEDEDIIEGEGTEDDPDAEGDDDLIEGEGEDEDLDAEGDDELIEGEDEEEDLDAEEEEEAVAMRAAAFASLPGASRVPNLVKSLARERKMTMTRAKARIRAANRDVKVASRRDLPVGANGKSGKKSNTVEARETIARLSGAHKLRKRD